jgi:transcriptional regulator with XRE-family HTH domain
MLFYTISGANCTHVVNRDRPGYDEPMGPPTDEFRLNVRRLLDRSGLSMRQLSAAFGRDPGYISSLLDPTRPARSRPTPEDLLRASDVLEISFIELLEALWGIPASRLSAEAKQLTGGDIHATAGAGFTERDRASLADYAAYLEDRSKRQGR